MFFLLKHNLIKQKSFTFSTVVKASKWGKRKGQKNILDEPKSMRTKKKRSINILYALFQIFFDRNKNINCLFLSFKAIIFIPYLLKHDFSLFSLFPSFHIRFYSFFHWKWCISYRFQCIVFPFCSSFDSFILKVKEMCNFKIWIIGECEQLWILNFITCSQIASTFFFFLVDDVIKVSLK